MFRLCTSLNVFRSGIVRNIGNEGVIFPPMQESFYYSGSRFLSEAAKKRKKRKKKKLGETGAVSNKATTASASNKLSLIPQQEERKKALSSTPITPPILQRPAIRKRLDDPNDSNEIPTGLSVTFLGVGSGQPTLARAPSSVLVRYLGGSFLFDAGEGTQLQLEKSGVSPKYIDHIFISHLHGDNLWGLPNVICDIAAYRQSPRGLPHVFGPVGTRKFLDTAFQCAQGRPRRSLCLVSEMHLPENRATNPLKAETKRLAEKNYLPKSVGGKCWRLGEIPIPGVEDGMEVTACRLQHNAPSFGFVFSEPDELKTFHPDIAEKLGVPKGLIWNSLESGKTVRFDRKTVHPHQVFTRIQGRKLVVLGDTADSENIRAVAMDADALIHEATVEHRPELVGSPLAIHSSAQMALRFAQSVNAKSLFLTHFGPEINPQKELEKAAPNHNFTGQINIAEELKTYHIPKTEIILPPTEVKE